MPPFLLTTNRLHFGYLREAGIHHDLTEADCANLEGGGHGRRLDPADHVVADQEPVTDEAPPSDPASHLPPASGEGQDDPTSRPDDPAPGPFSCRQPECKKPPFAQRVGRDTHERSKHGRVLAD